MGQIEQKVKSIFTFLFSSFYEAILKYHVVSGAYFSAGLKNNMELTTLQGDKLKIVIDQNSTYKLFIFCKTIIIIKCEQNEREDINSIFLNIFMSVILHSILSFDRSLHQQKNRRNGGHGRCIHYERSGSCS